MNRLKKILALCATASFAATLMVATPAVAKPAEQNSITSAVTSEKLASRASVLKKNRLYKAGRLKTGKCAAQSTIPLNSAANLNSYYASVLNCLNKSWKRMDGKAFKYQKAKLVLHSGQQVSRKCRALPLSYYCPPENTIYMYANEIVNPWLQYQGNPVAERNIRLSAAHTIAHEYGHHVQKLSKIFAAFNNRFGTLDENRLELQASCLAEVWMGANADTYGVTAEDWANAQYWRYIVVPHHGSAQNQQVWGDRGYVSRKPGSCNTWKASKSSIL